MLKKFFKYFFVAVVAIAAINIFAYYQNVNYPSGGGAAEFVVTPGESIKAISRNLYADGFIKSKIYFEFYVWQAGKEKDLQAGTYSLDGKMTIKDIVKLLASGKANSREKEITIIPGWTLSDIADYLAKQDVASSSVFFKITGLPRKNYQAIKNAADRPKDYSAQFDFLADKPKNYGLEGYLFPDTYRIYKDAGAADVIEKMLANFGGKLSPDLRAELKKQDKTIYEIVTMASIVEKEVSKTEDMKIVAGIFWKRIGIGMPLQSDATLTYALGENKASHTIAETKTDSPYNTYKYRGLPPGPICNPSLEAIEAAIYPVATAYSYFLSRPDTGETIFSKTLEEHNQNKARYLK
jgi:UPF0755 protein